MSQSGMESSWALCLPSPYIFLKKNKNKILLLIIIIIIIFF